MSEWYEKWRVKINQNKSFNTRTILTHKQEVCPNVALNNVPILTSDTIRYLELYLV